MVSIGLDNLDSLEGTFFLLLGIKINKSLGVAGLLILMSAADWNSREVVQLIQHGSNTCQCL